MATPRTSISSSTVSIITESLPGRNVAVIFDASKELSTNVLAWTVQQIIQPHDVLTVIGVFNQVTTPMGYKSKANLTSFNGVNSKFLEEEAARKTNYYTLKLKEIQKICEKKDTKLDIRIKTGHSLSMAVVQEAKQLEASWVVLDRSLKRHSKYITEQLRCNAIMMDHNAEGQIVKLIAPVVLGPSQHLRELSSDSPHATSLRGFEDVLTNSDTDDAEPFTPRKTSGISKDSIPENEVQYVNKNDESTSTKQENAVPKPETIQVDPGVKPDSKQAYQELTTNMKQDNNNDPAVEEPGVTYLEQDSEMGSYAPPLCSICKYKSPDFGKDFSSFTFSEIEKATNNFSPENFLDEGGYGAVYRGMLHGQHVAVKQHKLASSQGSKEFLAEVEILGYAQHRNLITLLGYCIEGGEKMLVYEYICNKSLNWHLSEKNPDVLPWSARVSIAIGTARGLRYLHEDCRVCIIHRDVRPHNILLTHDYTPMVGDFGLARWHNLHDSAPETKVVGTLGYLSPEYASSGQVSDKADVFSFGVVLLELITGRRAIDLSLPMGQISLAVWARDKLDIRNAGILVDSRLADEVLGDLNKLYEVQKMIHAASFCIRSDPSHRAKMSQILRVLEG